MQNRICFAIAFATVLACALPRQTMAQTDPTAVELVLAGGPMQVGPGDHVRLCATNLGPASVTIILQIRDALTGAVVWQQGAGLPPSEAGGSTGSASGSCAQIDSSSTAILIGLLKVNPQPLPPGDSACGPVAGRRRHLPFQVVASLQAFADGVPGTGALVNPRIVQLIPLHPPNPCVAANSP